MAKKKTKVLKKKKKTTKKASRTTKKTKKRKKSSKKKKGTTNSFFDDCININSVDELYSYINKVQINLEPSPKLQLNENNYGVALNIIKDAGLPCKVYKTRQYLIRINPDSDKDYNARVDESVNEFITEFFGTDDIIL